MRLPRWPFVGWPLAVGVGQRIADGPAALASTQSRSKHKEPVAGGGIPAAAKLPEHTSIGIGLVLSRFVAVALLVGVNCVPLQPPRSQGHSRLQ